jgi:hypothetical protein
VRLVALYLIAAVVVLCQVKAQPPPSKLQQGDDFSRQHFVCHTGYTLEKCHADVAALQKALAKYPVVRLGEWTWVLVRSEDWKAIVTPRGLNPDSPAFTYYAGRETFFEDALVAEVPRRRFNLSALWGMSIEDLLVYAIAHELGHALCNEWDEAKANRAAKLVRQGRPPSCEANLQAKRRPGEDASQLNGHGNLN